MRPSEGDRLLVTALDVSHYGPDQFVDACYRQASDLPLGQFAEEALHQVELVFYASPCHWRSGIHR